MKEESEENIILEADDKREKKDKFFDLAGNIYIDENAVNQLRKDSML